VIQFSSNVLKNLSEGKSVLLEKYNIDCTRQTIKNCLNGNGLKCFIKRKKPFLSASHIKKRLDFAKKFSSFSYFDWKKVIWSDECKFSLINTNKKEFYWSSRSEPLKEANIKKTTKFGGKSLMVWGSLTGEGVGELVRINGTIDSKEYVRILSTGLINTMEKFSLDTKGVLFMQDNAPCHTSRDTKKWLKINKINVLDWPAQSPDMNPIENVWDIIDRRIRKRAEQPSNVEELWNFIQEEWYSLDKQIIKNLYLSMTTRIHELKVAKGKYTKY
jgi:transposase